MSSTTLYCPSCQSKRLGTSGHAPTENKNIVVATVHINARLDAIEERGDELNCCPEKVRLRNPSLEEIHSSCCQTGCNRAFVERGRAIKRAGKRLLERRKGEVRATSTIAHRETGVKELRVLSIATYRTLHTTLEMLLVLFETLRASLNVYYKSTRGIHLSCQNARYSIKKKNQ